MMYRLLVTFSSTTNINDFSGFLDLRNERLVVTAEHTIPAGAILTSSGVMGVVYATGDDRKCQMVQAKVRCLHACLMLLDQR
jgi:hypothetical protein